jgi:hypothetical protein
VKSAPNSGVQYEKNNIFSTRRYAVIEMHDRHQNIDSDTGTSFKIVVFEKNIY